MAETMTYDPGTDTVTTENNLTESEQESLAIGEEMANQQEQMLAGKYENAQQLEKAYIELEKKLGGKSEEDSTEDTQDSTEASDKSENEETSNDAAPNFAFLDDFYDQASSEKGEISKEVLDKIGQMSTVDFAQQYLQWRAAASERYIEKPDLSEQDVTELKGLVGGEQNYNNMLKWAQTNLSEQEINMFDTVMGRGDAIAAFFAVNSLAQRYQDKVGYDGKMLTGTAAKGSTDTFRSQQEVVQAMSDPRYDKDAAYRNDIMEKLARSDIKF